MRKQVRPAAPEIFAANAAAWNDQWKKLREGNPSASFAWYVKDGLSAREMILPTLRTMNQFHCSFCDSYPIEASTDEPIEHFRPKHDPRFHHLAYDWGNLYYCCRGCQGKGSKWSDDPEPLAPDAADYDFVD